MNNHSIPNDYNWRKSFLVCDPNGEAPYEIVSTHPDWGVNEILDCFFQEPTAKIEFNCGGINLIAFASKEVNSGNYDFTCWDTWYTRLLTMGDNLFMAVRGPLLIMMPADDTAYQKVRASFKYPHHFLLTREGPDTCRLMVETEGAGFMILGMRFPIIPELERYLVD